MPTAADQWALATRPTSIGIDGRLRSESMAGFDRNLMADIIRPIRPKYHNSNHKFHFSSPVFKQPGLCPSF